MSRELDVDHLRSLAKDKSTAGRTELASVIDDLFGNSSNVLSDRERRLMFNIIETLIHEVEMAVRQSLSRKLAQQPDIPHDLIISLASDEIEVAYPVLTGSTVLRDEDLIEIIRHRTEEYHLAITLRDEVNEGVSDALVETGSETVIESLLKNENARISSATMAYLVDQSQRVDTFQEPLLHRRELDDALAKRMFVWVSDALRTFIVDRYELDENETDALLQEAHKEAIQKQEQDHTAYLAGSYELIRELKEEGMITSDMLVKAIATGEVPLFVSMFSDMTGLDDRKARRILFEEEGESIAIACQAIGITEYEFVTIYTKTRKVAPQRETVSAGDMNNMLSVYRDIDPGNARHLLDRWTRAGGESDSNEKGAADVR